MNLTIVCNEEGTAKSHDIMVQTVEEVASDKSQHKKKRKRSTEEHSENTPSSHKKKKATVKQIYLSQIPVQTSLCLIKVKKRYHMHILASRIYQTGSLIKPDRYGSLKGCGRKK